MHAPSVCTSVSIAHQTGRACGTVGHLPHPLALSRALAFSLALAVAVANGFGWSGDGGVVERDEPSPFVGTAGTVVPV